MSLAFTPSHAPTESAKTIVNRRLWPGVGPIEKTSPPSCHNLRPPRQSARTTYLTELVDQKHEKGDRTADLGEKDCHHRADRREPRSGLRRQISESTTGSNVSDRPFHPGDFLWRWPSSSRNALNRELRRLCSAGLTIPWFDPKIRLRSCRVPDRAMVAKTSPFLESAGKLKPES
jgi:hypothetical protein